MIVAPQEKPLHNLSDEMLSASGQRVILPVLADVTTDSGRATIVESVRCCLQTTSTSALKSYVAHVVYFSEMLCNEHAMSQHARSAQCFHTYELSASNLRCVDVTKSVNRQR